MSYSNQSEASGKNSKEILPHRKARGPAAPVGKNRFFFSCHPKHFFLCVFLEGGLSEGGGDEQLATIAAM